MDSKFISLPKPTSPHACSPESGPERTIPSFFIVSIFLWVAILLNISTFIAGATRSGHDLARQRLVRRSSAKPLASLAMKLPEAGAINNKSAALVRLICSIPLPSVGSHIFSKTGFPDRAWRVNGVTNCLADFVKITCTKKLCLRSSLINSAVL